MSQGLWSVYMMRSGLPQLCLAWGGYEIWAAANLDPPHPPCITWLLNAELKIRIHSSLQTRWSSSRTESDGMPVRRDYMSANSKLSVRRQKYSHGVNRFSADSEMISWRTDSVGIAHHDASGSKGIQRSHGNTRVLRIYSQLVGISVLRGV